MSSVIRGSDNFDSLVHQGIGVNQTWQDVTASRVLGVTYTNTTGKPIMLNIISSYGIANVSISINGVIVYAWATGSTNINVSTGNILIPSGMTYVVSMSNVSLGKWSELR